MAFTFTGNKVNVLQKFSLRNQMFISYTNNGALGKGFSAAITIGKLIVNFSLFWIFRHVTNIALSTVNVCDNALDLANRILTVEDNLSNGTYCQWLISVQDNNGYVTLEFQNFNVRNTYYSTKIFLFNYVNLF